MKALFLADTQIGVSTVDLADQQAVLARIVQVALDRQVDVVVHGGDVFEGPTVTPEHLRVFLDAIQPLRDAKIPLYVIRGNGRHDSAVRAVHALDVLREIDGIHVADRPGVFPLYRPDMTVGAMLCALPWVHPGNLIAEMALNINVDHDEVSALASRMLVEIADDLHPDPLSYAPAVLIVHWAISGSALPSGLSADEMREPVLPWADLDALGYDLIVGAHIHQPQRLGDERIDKTPGFVVGSPQQLNHGESGEHGCWVVDFGGDTPSVEFVAIPSREFLTLDVEVAGEGALVDPTEWLTTAFSDMTLARCRDAIVRFRYTATEDQARRIDQATVRRMLVDAGASRVTIQPQVVKTTRARSEKIHDQLGPVEALLAYAEAQDVPEALRSRMVQRLEEWIAA